VVLILVGVLLLTDSYSALNAFFLRLTPEWLQKYL
jgi:cytochrome c-type biogenesis protein